MLEENYKFTRATLLDIEFGGSGVSLEDVEKLSLWGSISHLNCKSLKYLFDQKELGMRQKIMNKFLKDYDLTKTNIFEDVSYRKTVQGKYN